MYAFLEGKFNLQFEYIVHLHEYLYFVELKESMENIIHYTCTSVSLNFIVSLDNVHNEN